MIVKSLGSFSPFYNSEIKRKKPINDILTITTSSKRTERSEMANIVEEPWNDLWDTLIIGAGPAGVSAGIYAVRGGLKTLIVEKQFVGGQIALTYEVENYPGYPIIGGLELAQKLSEHLDRFSVPMYLEGVRGLSEDADGKFLVEVDSGRKIPARTLIIASGSSPNRLPAENEEKFYGRGVSYCAVCDGPFFKGKPVAVVGGGDAAIEEATYLASICSEVTLIHRRREFRAQPLYVERLRQKPNVFFKQPYVVTSIFGNEEVDGAILKNVETGEEERLFVSAVFVFIGHTPNTSFARGFVDMSEDGQIYVDHRMRTSRRGVFAVGDLTYRSLKQMVISCGEGCTAAIMARHFLENGKWEGY